MYTVLFGETGCGGCSVSPWIMEQPMGGYLWCERKNMACIHSRTGVNKLWPKSALLPVFVNEVLLGCNQTHIYLYIIYGCSHATTAELRAGNRNCLAHKAQNI